ncbi:MAG: HAD-IIIA family hydrolase [Candidatus Omnitrophica bacterium]|nr:HAD-IIIA family hydrolase [Candidatus Omnitrophota bacterium]
MIEQKAKNIKLLIMDVDGVLTDGRIVYTDGGDQLKFFSVLDGMGLALLSKSGIKSAILTAKKSRIVTERAKDMHIDRVYQDAVNKLKVFKEVLSDFKVKSDEVCFIGDDVLDIPVLRKVGLAVSVPNAVSEVKNEVHYITIKHGGKGAVREVIDMILKHQGKMDSVIKKFYED